MSPSNIDGIEASNIGYLSSLASDILFSIPRYPAQDPIYFSKNEKSKAAIICLPGSYLDVRYLSDLCCGMWSPTVDILGLNYPGHGHDLVDGSAIDDLSLFDYVHSIYHKMLEVSQGYENVYIIGHSLGTIIAQLLVWTIFTAKTEGLQTIPLSKVVILGGGPPKLCLVDYLATTFTRLGTMSTVFQMVNNPSKFVSPEGDIKKTLDSRTLEHLRRSNCLYQESKQAMRQAFFGSAHHFVPKKILAFLGIKTLFIFAKNDFFVADISSRRAIDQWGAESREISEGHSGIVVGEVGLRTGVYISRFLET